MTMTFTPRPEFVKDPPHTRHAFSLLTLASSNCIRLYSFPLHIISALRRLLGENAVAFREDVINNFCEFALESKPWSAPKSIATEALFLEILTVIYQHGYNFLSAVNYGREHDESLALAFSISESSSNQSTSLLPSASPETASLERTKTNPFAISFVSATLLRVISPPLHSTPAILQAVRGSWPRGVVSEKKVGHNSYEFRLKGYKWFQEDTFATDSLTHILALLSSLDAHSFSLLTSISLTSRSRVKDLWIFTGLTVPSMDDTPPSSVLGSSLPDLKRVAHAPEQSLIQHRRIATDPVNSPNTPQSLHHPRALTDGANGGRGASLLRKPAPRVQLPLSVHDDQDREGMHVNLPSVIDEDREKLAGISSDLTPDVLYATSPFAATDVPHSPAPLHSTEPQDVPRAPTTSSRSNSPVQASSRVSLDHKPQAELLSSTVFRESASSTSTNMSAEIPIKWTGDPIRPALQERESLVPIPGGWQPTPIEEKAAQLDDQPLEIALDNDKHLDGPLQEVTQRVSSPEMNRVSSDIRRSEAGIVEMSSDQDNSGPSGPESNGKGWVLVNVEGKASPPPDSSSAPPSAGVTESPESMSGKSAAPEPDNGTHPNATMSPAAKAIVIIDAVDAKKSKSADSSQSPSRFKRLLSLRGRGQEGDKTSALKSQLGLQNRMKLLRTPQATRNEGKRRSIDG